MKRKKTKVKLEMELDDAQFEKFAEFLAWHKKDEESKRVSDKPSL